MIDIFTLDLIRYSFFTGLILSFLCGFLSFFVIEKKLSFLTVAISHSAFGALALALLVNYNSNILLYVFCFTVAFAVYELKKRTIIDFETILGIFFAFTMALGIIFLKFSDNGAFDLNAILFGSVISSTKSDLLKAIFVSLLIFTVYSLFFKDIIFTLFDEDVAKVSGINTNFINYIILFSITLAIVIGIKIIGIILLTAFMTIPASIALSFTNSYRVTILVSTILSLFIFSISFFIAYFYDLPPGATTVVIGTIIFTLINIIKLN
ncbi:metal ABC transporter permease [Deferribacter abyssi]|uniref:metal ABC transporter permease n=1 Tax=Deferribacter abyssi TaxID=213806 RepID=UPI003C255446